MMPSHASMPLEDLERLMCREIGHLAYREMSAVAEFWICLRCGRFWRDDR